MARKLFVALLVVGLLLGALLVGALPAAAHDAPSGWSYSAECCSNADCAPVDDAAVQEVPGGFRVTLTPGSHPMVKDRTVTAMVPAGDPRLRKSGDWRKHVCVSGSGYLFCVYLPPAGT